MIGKFEHFLRVGQVTSNRGSFLAYRGAFCENIRYLTGL